KARSKKISRLCSSWARDENQERITVHAYVGGSGIQTVNAAYTSQTCLDPTCGYVHRDNRHGDVFHCRNPYWECNWQGDVDHVAAMNIKSRIKDRQINRFTPYTEVKKILDERFLRRMQSRVGARIVPLGTTGNGVRDTCVENGAMGYPSDPTDHSILRHRQSRATTAWVPPALGRLRWISLTELPLTAGL
ncbi:MAG: zinc ribbon domain-containing protein, partial [Ferrimicrobium sp.]